MPKWRLQTTIIFLVCCVVILALIVTNVLVSEKIAAYAKGIQEEKAKNIAKVVSRGPYVIEALRGQSDPSIIQEFTKDILNATEVQFIVVMDMEGIRKSHPDPEKIGMPFVGGDEKRVLQGEEYSSIAEGTLGVSFRYFSPVFDDSGQQVGAVAVGISLDEVETAIQEGRMTVFLGISLGGLIGLLGAWFLARKIRRVLFGLEPSEISKLLAERNVMLKSVREGIIAVDSNGIVTLINDEGSRLLRKAGIIESPLGRPIEELVSHSELEKVLATGTARYDQEQNLRGVALLVNTVPLLVEGNKRGAIATFRDLTEMRQMAQELSGVKLYAEALRAQSHEFMNKMHVILGMIQIGFYDKLKQYIQELTTNQQTEIGQVMSKIKDPVIAGFILGKLAHARERGITLELTGEDVLPELKSSAMTHEIVTIVGNLITNAFDAVESSEERRVQVGFSYFEEMITIEVVDTGPGMDELTLGRAFEKGFSTKGEENRGIGLYLLGKSVERLDGEVQVESVRGKGTRFTVEIPLRKNEVKK
ncbi:DcuS/MalK family sensor histidine kinase [Ammoniphilus sp. YIM 78166]|uniref:DcuS/MalK family sensor histidine kinase n=1 Tax=Ammoniphilus sp. YIM 78166 TaxID=1644106 RepID=UPI00106F4711|nr:DcuS/MalK family sensor histidine kinase [Ammoniphilus sp. YIM 78166]